MESFPPAVAALLAEHDTDEEVCSLRAALNHDPQALHFALLEWATSASKQEKDVLLAEATESTTIVTAQGNMSSRGLTAHDEPFAEIAPLPYGPELKSLYFYSQAMYNMLQRLVVPAVLRGASIVCESGSRSGRATCVAMIAERLIDPTAPIAKRRQLFVLCSEQKHHRLSKLLREHISLSTALVIAVDGPAAAQGILHPKLHSVQDAAATPLVVLLAEVTRGEISLDTSCIPRLLERLRFAGTPQFVALLNEPLAENARVELGHMVDGGAGRGPVLQHVASPHFFFRQLLLLSQGAGHFLSVQTEEAKVAVLERLLTVHLFDEPLIAVVAATRRKAELLSECCRRRVAASCAVSGRHAESLIKGRALVLDMFSQLPEPLARRACICTDQSGVTALFDGVLRGKNQRSPVLVFYDVPLPALLVGEIERKVGCDEGIVIVLATTGSSEAANLEKQSPLPPGSKWIQLAL